MKCKLARDVGQTGLKQRLGVYIHETVFWLPARTWIRSVEILCEQHADASRRWSCHWALYLAGLLCFPKIQFPSVIKSVVIRTSYTIFSSFYLFLLWSEFLATDTEVPGSIPGTARFFWVVVGLERGLLSLVQVGHLDHQLQCRAVQVMMRESLRITWNQTLKSGETKTFRSSSWSHH